jgi:hypothetical protein
MSICVDEHCLEYPEYWPPLDSPSAWLEHVPFAFWIVNVLKPQLFVELGVHYGMSYFAVCQTVRENQLPTRCHGVDTWQGDEHASFYSEAVFLRVDQHNRAHYAEFSTLLRMRFDEALAHIEDGSVDLLHVDGRHFYDDVKADFESWIPKLSPRAVVMFHDTEVRERGFGVWKYWSELREHYPSFNFLHGHGLGVIAFGPEANPSLQDLFSQDAESVSSVRRIFSTCGKNLSNQWERRVEQDAHRQRLEELQGALKTSRSDTDTAGRWSEVADDLRLQLASARAHPLQTARDYVEFNALRLVLNLGLPLSERKASQLASSAAKRDPNRSGG